LEGTAFETKEDGMHVLASDLEKKKVPSSNAKIKISDITVSALFLFRIDSFVMCF